MDVHPRLPLAETGPLTIDSARLQLAALQYELIRAESNQTRQDQQSIINWNQAMSVALFAAGLYGVAENVPSWIPRTIFGLVLPAVLVGGAMAWAGEMIRMERTGAYLRMLERGIWEMLSQGDGKVETGWFVWENILWSPPAPMARSGFRKQNIGYVGIVLFYGVLYLGAVAVLAAISPPLLAVLIIPLIVIVSAALLLPAARHVYRLGGHAPEMSMRQLNEWAETLMQSKPLAEQGPVFQSVKVAFGRLNAARRRRTGGGN